MTCKPTSIIRCNHTPALSWAGAHCGAASDLDGNGNRIAVTYLQADQAYRRRRTTHDTCGAGARTSYRSLNQMPASPQALKGQVYPPKRIINLPVCGFLTSDTRPVRAVWLVRNTTNVHTTQKTLQAISSKKTQNTRSANKKSFPKQYETTPQHTMRATETGAFDSMKRHKQTMNPTVANATKTIYHNAKHQGRQKWEPITQQVSACLSLFGGRDTCIVQVVWSDGLTV